MKDKANLPAAFALILLAAPVVVMAYTNVDSWGWIFMAPIALVLWFALRAAEQGTLDRIEMFIGS